MGAAVGSSSRRGLPVQKQARPDDPGCAASRWTTRHNTDQGAGARRVRFLMKLCSTCCANGARNSTGAVDQEIDQVIGDDDDGEATNESSRRPRVGGVVPDRAARIYGPRLVQADAIGRTGNVDDPGRLQQSKRFVGYRRRGTAAAGDDPAAVRLASSGSSDPDEHYEGASGLAGAGQVVGSPLATPTRFLGSVTTS